MSKRRNAKKAAMLVFILILVLGMIYSGLQILESTVFRSDAQEETIKSKTVTKDGVSYFPRQDITVVMALGIDELGPVVSSGYYRNNGECDVVNLLILDQKEESYTILTLNRDSMVEMPALGLGGKKAGTAYGQLALSHTYGDGLEASCENTRETVSNLLKGIRIDHYVAMNMDGVGIINDAVGGVTVNVTDDFSKVDPTIRMGQMTLKGSQALTFIQNRHDVGNQLNISRMGRHRAYMEGLIHALGQKLDSSDTFGLQLYDQIYEYMVTDCSANVITGLMQRCTDYTLKEIVSPEGQNVLGEEYYEFYLDEEALDELVLRLFYAPK